MRKRNIAVLFGGCSPEHGVSLESAYSVICNIDRERFNPILIGISQRGDWNCFCGDVRKIREGTWLNPADCTPATLSVNRSDRALLVLRGGGVQRIPLDAAFPVLHGKNGEDGTVQGLVELAGIPLVGCGALATALCMDKDRAHRLAAASGVAAPDSRVVRAGEREQAAARAAEVGWPLFVKPVGAGSSFGVTRVSGPEDLAPAVELAFSYDDRILLEKNVEGFEVGCAVLGNDELTVGAVDEIELSEGFFSFEEKYTLKSSVIHVPARITPGKAAEIRQTAETVYRALGCRGFARVDLFLTPDGRIIFNEVNTIPGFTSHSRFPSMMQAAGIPFGELLTRAVELAFS